MKRQTTFIVLTLMFGIATVAVSLWNIFHPENSMTPLALSLATFSLAGTVLIIARQRKSKHKNSAV